MALKFAIFALVSIFLLTSTNEATAPVGGHYEVPTPAPAPAPRQRIYINFEECPFACTKRCSLHSRQNLCNRVCMTCCKSCHCVPPGTAGNQEMCGTCYTDWKTHGNRTKCP